MAMTDDELTALESIAWQVSVTNTMQGTLRTGYRCPFCGVQSPTFLNVTHANTCAYSLARAWFDQRRVVTASTSDAREETSQP